jgi:2-dehydro-3-deoxygalactonokinase
VTQVVTHPGSTALIAIDWGTTSARAYRLDAGGAVEDARSAPLGIGSLTDGRFSSALDTLLGDWREDDVPRIACGMIGSRQGWIEAPYVECPADLQLFGSALTSTPGGELRIVPGARCTDAAGVPDVMRGEETQLVGAIRREDAQVVAVLPGTHSKWALVENGRLVEFATFMTGELYAVLLAHTILGRMARERSGEAIAAFDRGVARGSTGGGLAHAIFGARTLALGGELAPEQVGDWLSGVLIGDEIRAAREWAREHGVDPSSVRVIGEGSLVARYVRALEALGIRAEPGPSAAAAAGLYRVAQLAGLLAS